MRSAGRHSLVTVLLDDQGYIKLELGQTNMQSKWETFVAKMDYVTAPQISIRPRYSVFKDIICSILIFA